MIKSLITELNQKDVDFALKAYTVSDFYHPTLFPKKYKPTLKWESLEGVAAAPVAGDVIAFDAKSPRKTRPRFEKASGSIGKIGVAREMTETELNDYRELKYKSRSDAGQRALVDFIYEDVEFVFKGINARLEWMSLQAASTGKCVLTSNTNDGGVVTETAVDFLIPTANKIGTTVSWTTANAATSKPITNIKAILKAAKAKQKKLKFMFMDEDTFDALMASEETQKKIASIFVRAVNLTEDLTSTTVKSYFQREHGLSIAIIESYVTLETKGVQTEVNCWEPGVVLFSETSQLGDTMWTDLADSDVESTTSIKSVRDNIMVKIFATEEPLTQTTLAISNSMPVVSGAVGKWLLDTQHTGFLVNL